MRKLFLSCIMLLMSVAVFAQAKNVTITGTVIDENKLPLPGVAVVMPGTSIGTSTDGGGKYSLAVPESAELSFSMIGYVKQNIKVAGKSVIDVVLKESKQDIAEIVVTGYSRQERRDITGSVSSIKMPEHKTFSSVDQMLAGQAPGVFMSKSSGALGAANILTIRGTSSIMGNNNPLYVVDGVPIYSTDRESNTVSTTGSSSPATSFSSGTIGGGSMSYNSNMKYDFEKNPLETLNPDDIESIEILKDAFATAIYGSRGAAGVILITTKKGSRDRTKVDVSYSFSIDNPLGQLDLLNGEEYSMIYNKYYKTDKYGLEKANTNWLDQITRTAYGHALTGSVSGGTEKTNYFVSVSMNDNDSYIINNDMKRYSARLNIDSKLSKMTTLGANVSLTQLDNNALSAPAAYYQAVVKAPNLPVYNDDRTYFYGSGRNPIGYGEAYNPMAYLLENKEGVSDSRIVGNMFLEVRPLDWLTLRTELGTDIYNSLTSVRKAPVPAYVPYVVNQNMATEDTKLRNRFVINNTVNINKVFGDHFIQAIIGQSYETSNEYSSKIEGRDFISPDLVGVGAAKTKTVYGAGKQQWALFSVFGRANYQYKRRYMAGVTYRIDGSSRYNKKNRYLGTPSVSLAWRLSEESFIQDNADWIDDIKLRGSLGWSSMDSNNGYYGAQATYVLSTLSYGGNNYMVMNKPGNEGLNWEKTRTYDLGLDVSLWKKRLEVTLDYYYKKTTDMLFPSQMPSYTGYSTENQNIGDKYVHGIELRIVSMNIMNKNFSWMTTLNLSKSADKITKLDFKGQQLDINSLNSGAKYYAVGHPSGMFFLNQWEGINPLNGNPQWRLSDGTITEVPPASMTKQSYTDNKFISGVGYPSLFGGMTNTFLYKGFELNVLFTFSVGGKMINETKANLYTYSTEQRANNLSKDMLNYWEVPNQNTDVPRLDHKSIVSGKDYAVSSNTTRFLEDNSYLRLKSMEVAYNVPADLLFAKTGFIRNARIFVAATNLFTVTNYSGIDPEVSAFGSSALSAGYDNITMPQSRSFQFGIRLGF